MNSRAKPIDPPDQTQPAEEEIKQNEPSTLNIKDILPIHPAAILFVPFRLNIENIGFTNLQVHLDQQTLPKDQSYSRKVTQFQGLSTSTSLHWAGTKSNISFKVGNIESEEISNLNTKEFTNIIDSLNENLLYSADILRNINDNSQMTLFKVLLLLN